MVLNVHLVTRYVTPLREGGSVPALVEADNQGTYVMKLRGAAQGHKALVADLLGTQVARALGLPVADLVLLQLEEGIARMEADEELRDLLKRSTGLNLGVDWLPGALAYDAGGRRALEPAFRARVVWLDLLLGNVDRTARNPNLLWWHGGPWLIDHGAALTFHHRFPDALKETPRIPGGGMHVLGPGAGPLDVAHGELSPRLTRALLGQLVEDVPDAWLDDLGGFATRGELRAAYVECLWMRHQAMPALAAEWEAQRGRA